MYHIFPTFVFGGLCRDMPPQVPLPLPSMNQSYANQLPVLLEALHPLRLARGQFAISRVP